MGTIDFQQPIVSTSKTIMKLFLIAAVLIASVCAEPESEAKADAKPWLAYSNYGYAGYPYAAGYAAYPYAGVYGAGYNGYATGYRYLGKRSADSESDAKPWLTYANYGYPYASTYGAYAGAYAAAPAVYGAGYAAYTTPYTTYGAAHLIGKREAEADSEAKPWLAYSNYGYAGYPYASTYGAYAYPSVYRHAAYAAPAYTTYGAAHLIGKRSADSEPESWYGAYGYASPYTYGGYGSYGYSAYRPYTYGRVYGAYNGYY